MIIAFTAAFTAACVLAMAVGFVMARRNAGLADHTTEPLYECCPVCAPACSAGRLTPAMEHAFGKSDAELVRDMIEYEKGLK
jgi:hypothetical protein